MYLLKYYFIYSSNKYLSATNYILDTDLEARECEHKSMEQNPYSHGFLFTRRQIINQMRQIDIFREWSSMKTINQDNRMTLNSKRRECGQGWCCYGDHSSAKSHMKRRILSCQMSAKGEETTEQRPKRRWEFVFTNRIRNMMLWSCWVERQRDAPTQHNYNGIHCLHSL